MSRARMGVLSVLALTSAACAPTLRANEDPDAGPIDAARFDGGGRVTSIVVDATHNFDWRYLDLETGAFVETDVPAPSTTWDLAFQRFKILSNGGVTGPGSASVARLADTDWESLTQAPDAGYIVDMADGDADDDTAPDSAFVNGVDDWYDYEQTTHYLTPKARLVYVVRTSDDHYFKVRVTGYYDAAGTPGFVGIEWGAVDPPGSAMLPDAGPIPDAGVIDASGDAAVLVPDDALTIDASTHDVWTYFDLETASTIAVVDPATDAVWDVAFSRTLVRTSSGTSSPQLAGARFVAGARYEDVTSTGTLGFAIDELVDDGSPGSTPTSLNPSLTDWYDYDLRTHTLTATPGVFVVRSAEGAYFRLRYWDWVDGVFRISVAPIEVEPETITIEADVSVAGTRLYFDLHAGSAIDVTDAGSDGRWDLAIERVFLATSSGTSGGGAGGALGLSGATFDEVTNVPVTGFEVDTTITDPSPEGGTYSANASLSAWYDYDEATHVLTPLATTFAVALADGSVGKLAVTGYEAGVFTLRWAYAGPHRSDF